MSRRRVSQLPLALEPFTLTPPEPSRVGRPPGGKRSDPDYEQVTIYIRRKHHRAAALKLKRAGKSFDFSDLVDVLVAEWDRSTSR
jgi:hypothetical protein